MVQLVVSLAAPLIATPLLVFCCRHLFTVFLREGSSLFVGLDMAKPWAAGIGQTMAVINGILFTFAWWATASFSYIQLSAFIVALPFVAAVLLGLTTTSLYVKSQMRLAPMDAWMVGLLSFAGGNLPMIVIIPLLLNIAPQAAAMNQ